MALPSSFAEFLGNTHTVENLRASVAAGRLPHSLILSGPRGAGKYTLSLMLTMALECERQPREGDLASFCGEGRTRARISEAAELDSLVATAAEAREEMREVDKKDTRILIQTHPDVLVIPPDPPQLLIKLGQVRSVVQSIYRLPAEAPHAVYIFTSTAFMKEAANSLLKVLEEPPAYAHILLLAENTGELLPTIRSRASIFRLGALPPEDIEAVLGEQRKDWKPKQRALVARLAEGGIGQALGFNLEAYLASRQDALVILSNATQDSDYGALFRVTETYRAGAEGQQKTSALLHAVSNLLEDLLLLHAGTGHL